MDACMDGCDNVSTDPIPDLSIYSSYLYIHLSIYLSIYSCSGFSGTVPLDTIVFSGYNFYLGLPVLVLGMDYVCV